MTHQNWKMWMNTKRTQNRDKSINKLINEVYLNIYFRNICYDI